MENREEKGWVLMLMFCMYVCIYNMRFYITSITNNDRLALFLLRVTVHTVDFCHPLAKIVRFRNYIHINAHIFEENIISCECTSYNIYYVFGCAIWSMKHIRIKTLWNQCSLSRKLKKNEKKKKHIGRLKIKIEFLLRQISIN